MGTVTKALSLLDFFNHSRPGIGLSEMARLSGLNKATTHRLLGELQTQGFVEQVREGGAYRLGSAVLRLAALREASVPLLSVSREVLQVLCDATGETAHMSVVQGSRLDALSYVYSPAHATKVTMDDAEVLDFHATSSGLAVLAFSAPGIVDAVLAAPLRPRTTRTMTDPAHIRTVLDEVRRSGIAESIGGFEVDVHSNAAPVFGADGQPIGALAVAAPVSRMTADRRAAIRAQVKASASTLTTRIGGFAPDSYPATQRSKPHQELDA